GALGGAAAGAVESNVGMEQEWDVVLRDVQVTLVDIGHPGHGIKILDLRPVGIVDDLTVFAVADAEDLIERLSVGELDDGEVELAAANEVDGGTLIESALGVGRDRRTDETNFEVGVGVANHLSCLLVARPAHRAGEDDKELV